MDMCPNCPAAGGPPCVAATTGHRRFCALVDPGHPDHEPAYRPLVARLSSGEPPPPAPRAAKPRLTFDQLAALRKRKG